MLTLKNAAPAAVSNSAVKTLKLLGQRHSRKLILTFLLVAAENITMLLYPLLAGFAINAIVTGQALHAVLYAVMVFVMWAIGAARRSIDTPCPPYKVCRSGGFLRRERSNTKFVFF